MLYLFSVLFFSVGLLQTGPHVAPDIGRYTIVVGPNREDVYLLDTVSGKVWLRKLVYGPKEEQAWVPMPRID